MVLRGVVVVSIVRSMSCLWYSRDLLGTERLECQCALTRSGVLRARRQGNWDFARSALAFFVCHSLLIEMRRLAANFSCHHAALGVLVLCVCVTVCAVQCIHTYIHTRQHILLTSSLTDNISLYLDRARLRKDTRPIAVSLATRATRLGWRRLHASLGSYSGVQ